ncbi:MAG: CHAT domain-containing protein [Bacteroidales bacterium]|nr:CHAT domain-containing protein [Bacteroidales bacterium]
MQRLVYRFSYAIVLFCIILCYSAKSQSLDSLIGVFEQSKNLSEESLLPLLDSIVDKAIDEKKTDVGLKYAEILQTTVRKTKGNQSVEYAKSLFYQGNLNEKIGRYDKAFYYLEESVAIYDKGIVSMEASKAFMNFGIVCYRLAMYKKSLFWYEKSQKMLQEILGDSNLEYAAIINNIGVVYYEMGDFEHCIDYYNQAAEITKQVLGEDNAHYALLLTNLGVTYYGLGLYEKALFYYEKAGDFFNDNTSNTAMSLLNIGTAYYSLQNYEMAMDYYQKALQILKEFSTQHPLEAFCYDHIGLLYTKKGEQNIAFDYLQKALKLREQLLGKLHPKYAATLNRIGLAYYNQGEYSIALRHFLQALSIFKQIYGEYNQEYLNVLQNICDVYIAQKQYDNALSCLLEIMKYEKKHLMQSFSFLTEKERDKFWERNKNWCKKINAIVYDYPENSDAVKALYDAVLIEKGLLLLSEREFRTSIQESDDSTLIAEYEQINMMRIVLEKQYEKSQDKRTINCDSLELVIEEKEKYLMKNVKEYADLSRAISMSWVDVQSALSDKDIAIEFLTTKLGNDSCIYSALILKRNLLSPVYVPLFEQNQLENKLKEDLLLDFDVDVLRGFADTYKEQREVYESTVLYEMLWKPLKPYLEGASRIYFSPSGVLHKIGIEYAPVSDTRIMSDIYEMHRVSSTKMLAMDNLSRKYTCCVLYGGVEYNGDTIPTGVRKPVSFLPGTKKEVWEIQSVLKEKSSIHSVIYEGMQATEESLKTLPKGGPSILHIATHGFFLDNSADSLKNSMDKSGLMFAGANVEWTNPGSRDSAEDGILTAKEISHLDLRKTELVVLSACQTALGIVSDEGVYGLQRGFKMAGVKTIIMSLWSVDDFATQMMMSEFYSQLTNGKSKKEAFSIAQSKVRKTFEDPFYWSGFIMLD